MPTSLRRRSPDRFAALPPSQKSLMRSEFQNNRAKRPKRVRWITDEIRRSAQNSVGERRRFNANNPRGLPQQALNRQSDGDRDHRQSENDKEGLELLNFATCSM